MYTYGVDMATSAVRFVSTHQTELVIRTAFEHNIQGMRDLLVFVAGAV